MLGNVFNLLNVEVWYQQLVRGAVILVAAGLYVQRRSVRGPEMRDATAEHRDASERSMTWP